MDTNLETYHSCFAETEQHIVEDASKLFRKGGDKLQLLDFLKPNEELSLNYDLLDSVEEMLLCEQIVLYCRTSIE